MYIYYLHTRSYLGAVLLHLARLLLALARQIGEHARAVARRLYTHVSMCVHVKFRNSETDSVLPVYHGDGLHPRGRLVSQPMSGVPTRNRSCYVAQPDTCTTRRRLRRRRSSAGNLEPDSEIRKQNDAARVERARARARAFASE